MWQEKKKKISATFAIFDEHRICTGEAKAGVEHLWNSWYLWLCLVGAGWTCVRQQGPVNASEKAAKALQLNVANQRRAFISGHCFQIAASHFSALHDNQSDRSNESIGWTRPPVSPRSIPEQPPTACLGNKSWPSRSEPKVKLIGSVKHPLLDPVWQRAHSAILSRRSNSLEHSQHRSGRLVRTLRGCESALFPK